MDLSKQRAFDADPKTKQQINFYWESTITHKIFEIEYSFHVK